MAQNDMNIANQGFPGFRADLNDALGALVSNSSGATEPATTFAHQYWVDTSANPSVLKIRNADNDAFITIGTINQTADTFTLTAAVSTTTLNTSGQVVFNDAGANVDFRVEGDTDANLLVVDASADAVGIGTATPAAALHINSTGAMIIPVGTTAQRPATPAKGMLRLNTDNNDFVEVFDGTAFVAVGEQTNDFLADFLVIAGGGGGGSGLAAAGLRSGGGGGAGGYREFTAQTLTLGTNFTVTVGGGGAGGPGGGDPGLVGSNSVFNTFTSAGGGTGGRGQDNSTNGGNGGSGGGAGAQNLGTSTGGTGNTPNTSPSQGNNGGNATGIVNAGGGGGGASAVGSNAATNDIGANGGNGTASSITGTSVTRAGGGGGGGNTAGNGGAGGGGNGGANTGAGSAGNANSGGGGGGAGQNLGSNPVGGAGGSGVVILKYPAARTISNPGGGLTLSTATAGGFSVTTVTAGTGNVSFA